MAEGHLLTKEVITGQSGQLKSIPHNWDHIDPVIRTNRPRPAPKQNKLMPCSPCKKHNQRLKYTLSNPPPAKNLPHHENIFEKHKNKITISQDYAKFNPHEKSHPNNLPQHKTRVSHPSQPTPCDPLVVRKKIVLLRQ